MNIRLTRVMTAALMLLCPLLAESALAQPTNDPFPAPIPATDGVITVNFVEFASLPDIDGQPARHDAGGRRASATQRLFVNDMRGPLYSVSYDGKTVTQYLDINAPRWESARSVAWDASAASRASRSIRSSTSAGSRGFGKFYTYTDTSNMTPTPDFKPNGGTHDARHGPARVDREELRRAATYDGGAPRELMRLRAAVRQPQRRPARLQSARRARRAPDFGLLYIGVGRRRQRRRSARQLAQNLGIGLRQDPAHRSARHQQRQRQVRHSREQPVRQDSDRDALGEIYAYGVRNPQRFFWDSEDRQHVHGRHRPEHRGRDQPGHRRREPRLERLGGQLPIHRRSRRSTPTTRAAIPR